MDCSTLIHTEHEGVIYYLIMGYLNETLSNKLILFRKIAKFDKFILILRLYWGEREATRDKIVTEMEIIYQ